MRKWPRFHYYVSCFERSVWKLIKKIADPTHLTNLPVSVLLYSKCVLCISSSIFATCVNTLWMEAGTRIHTSLYMCWYCHIHTFRMYQSMTTNLNSAKNQKIDCIIRSEHIAHLHKARTCVLALFIAHVLYIRPYYTQIAIQPEWNRTQVCSRRILKLTESFFYLLSANRSGEHMFAGRVYSFQYIKHIKCSGAHMNTVAATHISTLNISSLTSFSIWWNRKWKEGKKKEKSFAHTNTSKRRRRSCAASSVEWRACIFLKREWDEEDEREKKTWIKLINVCKPERKMH